MMGGPNTNAAEAGCLFLVATPIGNLEDITLRALRVLKEADLVACEDTRQTQKLLTHYSLRKRLVSYHEHNEMTRAPELVIEMEQGAQVALVSDAMPQAQRHQTMPRVRDHRHAWWRCACGIASRSYPFPGLQRWWRRWRPRGCRPKSSCLSASCPLAPASGARPSASSRRNREPWCCTRRRTAWKRPSRTPWLSSARAPR